MRVFVTGATGFVGSALVPELLNAGHQVLGLARSEASARLLIAAGAEVQRGELEDLESLRRGVKMSDGVIHAAFDHDFSKFVEKSETDRRVIEAIGDEIRGSDRPFVVTAGVPSMPNRPTTEDDEAPPPASRWSPRVSEQTALALVARGVRASVVRLPQVHDRDKQGFATYLVALAYEKRVSSYIGAGLNRWAAVHRLDAATVFRLALERGSPGTRYHAVAEEGVSVRAVAEAIGHRMQVPVTSLSPDQSVRHFGWLATPVSLDIPASSVLTQHRLGWHPTAKPGIIDDLAHARGFDGTPPGEAA